MKKYKCYGCEKEVEKLEYITSHYDKDDATYFTGVCTECKTLEDKVFNLLERKMSLETMTPAFKYELQDWLQKSLNYNLINPKCVCSKCGMTQGSDLVGWTNKYTVCPKCS